MSRRRPLLGKPLLVATAGLVISVSAGCPRQPPGNLMAPPGNLMAPPSIELCVTAEPPEAKVTVNGNELVNGCAPAYEGRGVDIYAEAQGYEPYKELYAPRPASPDEPKVQYKIQLKKLP